MYRFSAKSRTALLFQQQLFATWFVARQVWFEGGKTRNIVIPFVLQQCFETSSTFFLVRFEQAISACLSSCGFLLMVGPSPTHSLKRSNVKQENDGEIWKKLLLFFLYFLSSGRSVCRWRYQQGSKKRLIGGRCLKWARIGKPVRAR